MKLTRVTITGADDSVDPGDLADISREFGFVEWGILKSQKRQGSPRYPSVDWHRRLGRVCLRNQLNLSAHLCGSEAREVLDGVGDGLGRLRGTAFLRVQLNGFSASKATGLRKQLRACTDRRVILQCTAPDQLERALGFYGQCSIVDALYDCSGGRGVSPKEWPDPPRIALGMEMGYAGGIGPENVAEVLRVLSAKPMRRGFSIDMESKVRSNNDKKFDLGLVLQVLRVARRFVEST